VIYRHSLGWAPSPSILPSKHPRPASFVSAQMDSHNATHTEAD
jgi:hypothetical protein